MNPKRRAFVNAYIGEANGNGTKAAIIAGYSEVAAAQEASRLLKVPEIAEAIDARLAKADIRTDAILKRLGTIVHSTPDKVTGADVISASKVILQVNGALTDRQRGNSITVNIGFLTQPQAHHATTSDASHAIDATTLVLPQQAHVALPPGFSGEGDLGSAPGKP